MQKPSSPPALATLILLTAMATMTMNLIVPSLANIAEDLQADYATISIALGGYLAVTALVDVSVGPLADKIGRRPVLLVALTVFTCASLAGSMAQSAWAFLACRMLQAGIASGYILSLAIVRDTRTGPDVPRLLSKISMAMALAPMLGPMVGSLLDAAFGWRAIFLLYTAVGGGLLCLVWFDLAETRQQHTDSSRKEAGGVATLLRAPTFWCYVLCTAFSTSAFYVFLAGAPIIASSVFGIDTAQLGVFVGSITAGFIAGSFVAGRLARSLASTTVILLGRVAACSGMVMGLAILTFGTATPLLYFGCTIFVGFGNGLTTPNSNAGAMSVHPRLAGSAAGIIGATTLAGGALMTTGTGVVLADNPSPQLLMTLMLATSFAGLLAAIGAIRLERREEQSRLTAGGGGVE
ncbi:MAG: MFS transporter [Thalassobaculaceae bacterium]|nr:MFS transporter [Thalassobaculaceae bacterium]